MSTPVKMLVAVYVLIGLFVSVFGAFRYPILERAHGEYRRDVIESVRLAHVGIDDALYVCVIGTYEDDRQEYWIRVPVTRMAADPVRLEAEAGYEYIDYLAKWRIPRSNAAPGSCGVSPVMPARTVTTRSMEVDDIDGIFLHLDLSAELKDNAAAELVFELHGKSRGAGSAAGFAYGNESLDFNGRNVVRVGLDSRFVPGSKAWLFLLPFAWALDVILWPYVGFMWVSYAGAH